MRFINSLPVLAALSLLCASCDTVPKYSLSAKSTIQVDNPEIWDNAQLQSQLDTLRGELAGLGIVDTSTLTGALGSIQGATLSQTNFSLQALGRAAPSVVTTVPSSNLSQASPSAYTRQTTQAAVTPSIPAAPSASQPPAAPTISSDAIGLLDKQMQLESQVQGYELLLGGSDFARYTIDGLAKDRVVIGFPISIYPQNEDRNMAAEVDVTYFPPNADQFVEPSTCRRPDRFSPGDRANALYACDEQESAPTIINLLPVERSYNVVGVAQTATQFGAAAVVGTVGVGASGGTNHETQYLVAQQDTIALQGNGSVPCESIPMAKPGATGDEPAEAEREKSAPLAPKCDPGTKGVTFRWQFRPVLGESYVRAGRRVVYVQLAIPNVRRPYPNYGGIAYITTTWKPFDKSTGIIEDAPTEPSSDGTPPAASVVLGHTFVASEVSSIDTADLGGGSILVSLEGSYLTGATVRIGSTTLNGSTPGFVSDYNSIQFVTTVQALAQSGATLVSTEGVESPIDLSSICKSWDPISECALDDDTNPQNRLRITDVSVMPASASASLVRVGVEQGPPGETANSLSIGRLNYYHYRRNRKHGDVVGNIQNRDLGEGPYVVAIDPTADMKASHVLRESGRRLLEQAGVTRWPLTVTVGGKTYGLSDLPLQLTNDRPGHFTISVVVPNDALNSSPQLKVQRLFDYPADSSARVPVVTPSTVTLNVDAVWTKAAAQGDSAKLAEFLGHPCDPTTHECHYVLSGAAVGDFSLLHRRFACALPIASLVAHATPQPAQVSPQAGHATAQPIQVVTHPSQAAGRPELASLQLGHAGLSYVDLTVPDCAHEVWLGYLDKLPGGDTIVDTLVVPLATTAPTPGDAVVQSGVGMPHFKLSRAVDAVSPSSGTASLEVGIQNLKDQSATITVADADIVGVKDGTGNALTVQAGNSVTVYQDASLTIQVRNYAKKGAVNITVEGKNGTASSGKLSFATPFQILPESKASNAGGSQASS